MGDLERAVSADPVSPVWIADQLRVLELVGFFNPARERDPDKSTAAQSTALLAWVQALQGIPAPFIVRAFAEWRRHGTRWPVPGDITSRAKAELSEAKDRLRLCKGAPAEPAPFAPPADLTEAERARRAAIFKAWQGVQ